MNGYPDWIRRSFFLLLIAQVLVLNAGCAALAAGAAGGAVGAAVVHDLEDDDEDGDD